MKVEKAIQPIHGYKELTEAFQGYNEVTASFREYVEGYQLRGDEHLLKIRISKDRIGEKWTNILVGYLTKFTQDGKIPKKFIDWENSSNSLNKKIYVFEETYREGWRVYGYRTGMSQSWVKVLSPEGFIVEIYLSQFLELIRTTSLQSGLIIGEFKWEKNELIQKPN